MVLLVEGGGACLMVSVGKCKAYTEDWPCRFLYRKKFARRKRSDMILFTSFTAKLLLQLLVQPEKKHLTAATRLG